MGNLLSNSTKIFSIYRDICSKVCNGTTPYNGDSHIYFYVMYRRVPQTFWKDWSHLRNLLQQE
jgi:hypothetical protein